MKLPDMPAGVKKEKSIESGSRMDAFHDSMKEVHSLVKAVLECSPAGILEEAAFLFEGLQ